MRYVPHSGMSALLGRKVGCSNREKLMVKSLESARNKIDKSSWLTYIQARCFKPWVGMCDENTFPFFMFIWLFLAFGVIHLLQAADMIGCHSGNELFQTTVVFGLVWYLFTANFLRVLDVTLALDYLDAHGWSINKKKIREKINNDYLG